MIAGQPAPFDLHQDNDKLLDAGRRWLTAAGVPLGAAFAPATPRGNAQTAGAEEE
jgi:hypothetical protein